MHPTRRRTWAPCERTPIHRCWERHERFSVMGALTRSPQRRRLDFYFRLFTATIRTSAVLAFLSALQRHVRCPVVLVLDHWSVYRATVCRLRRRRPRWLAGLSWLTAYAPELHPVEQGWNHTKYSELANYLPDTLEQLHDAVGFSLASKHYYPALLRSFFQYAKLEL